MKIRILEDVLTDEQRQIIQEKYKDNDQAVDLKNFLEEFKINFNK